MKAPYAGGPCPSCTASAEATGRRGGTMQEEGAVNVWFTSDSTEASYAPTTTPGTLLQCTLCGHRAIRLP